MQVAYNTKIEVETAQQLEQFLKEKKEQYPGRVKELSKAQFTDRALRELMKNFK